MLLLSFVSLKKVGYVNALRLSIPQIVMVLVLLFGGLRCFDLAGKPFWLDEAFTAFHLSGYQDPQVHQIVTGQIRSAAEMLHFQQINPHPGWQDMVRHILETAPELPPLYFLLLRGWSHLWGPSVAALRGFSALWGVLLLPLVYQFCRIAFRDRFVGLLAVALVGLSPFHLLLSQEARPYSLWLVEVMVANIALVQAHHQGQRRHWVVYSLAMILAFYTHLISLLVLLTHGIAVLWSKRSPNSPNPSGWSMGKGFARSSLSILVAIAPWIWLGFLQPHALDENAYALRSSSLPELVKGLVRGVSVFFIDLNLNNNSPKPLLLLLAVLVGIILVALVSALGHAKRRDLWTVRLLAVMAILPPGIIFASDLLLKSTRSLSVRYFSVSHTMLEILVALVLVQSLNPHIRRWRLQLITALLLMGLASNLAYFCAPSWWHKSYTQDDRCIAAVTNSLDRPLLITDEFFVRTMGLSHGVQPALRFQVLPWGKRDPQLPNNLTKQAPPGQTFLYLPSAALQQAVSQRYNLEKTCGEESLLKISDRPS